MTDNFLPLLADRVLNRPLLILPDKLAVITEVLSGRIGIESAAPPPEASRLVGAARQNEPYRISPQGVAIISIMGSLVNRGAWIGAQSGLTSYEGIAHQLQTAARDPKVKSIILDLDSPGGEATGAFETASLVRKVSKIKPVYAYVNGMAASAAYAIASGAKAIISTESGMSGSIGVVLMHADYSRAIDKAGITPTLIHAGARKVDGNPYNPLPKNVRADLQKEVNTFYQMFLKTVAAGRGARLTSDAAKATEARTYIGHAARKAGLVDDTGTMNEIIDHISKTPSGARPKGNQMALNPDIFSEDFDREPEAANTSTSKADLDAEFQRGYNAGRHTGAIAERARIGALLSLPAAKADLNSAIKSIFESGAKTEADLKTVAASSYYSPEELAEKLNAESRVSKKGESNASRPAQPGAYSTDELVERMNTGQA